MIDKKLLDEIKNTAIEILDLAGFEAKIDVFQKEDQIILDISTEPAALLIGKQGQNLKALERVLQVVFYEKLGDRIISCDVAGFRKKRIEKLTEIARRAIDEVTATKTPKTLEGLTAAERKLVHLEVAKTRKLSSESTGEGVNRVLIIKPKE